MATGRSGCRSRRRLGIRGGFFFSQKGQTETQGEDRKERSRCHDGGYARAYGAFLNEISGIPPWTAAAGRVILAA